MVPAWDPLEEPLPMHSQLLDKKGTVYVHLVFFSSTKWKIMGSYIQMLTIFAFFSWCRTWWDSVQKLWWGYHLEYVTAHQQFSWGALCLWTISASFQVTTSVFNSVSSSPFDLSFKCNYNGNEYLHVCFCASLKRSVSPLYLCLCSCVCVWRKPMSSTCLKWPSGSREELMLIWCLASTLIGILYCCLVLDNAGAGFWTGFKVFAICCSLPSLTHRNFWNNLSNNPNQIITLWCHEILGFRV